MPLFEYSRYDGSQRFRRLSADALFDRLADSLLEHGEFVFHQLEQLDPEDAEALRRLLAEGYLEKDANQRYAVTGKGLRRIEVKALHELFLISKRDGLGQHPTEFKGSGQLAHEDSKPYEYGDPVASLNLHETLRNTLLRQGGGTPLRIAEEDLVVHEMDYPTSCATVLLLDMSGSMSRYGKFYEAKKVALGLLGLVRSRYRQDTLKVVGFHSYADPLTERELLRASPKPVSLCDSRLFLRFPLDRLPPDLPQHFTNIQAGLRLARQLLSRQPARNKQVLCVTDGEPTAHLEGQELVLAYPPGERTARATLEEARRCTAAGIQLCTLALIEDPFYLGLRNFVDRMARQSRGAVVYCTAGKLGGWVLDSFVHGRRSRKRVS